MVHPWIRNTLIYSIVLVVNHTLIVSYSGGHIYTYIPLYTQ